MDPGSCLPGYILQVTSSIINAEFYLSPSFIAEIIVLICLLLISGWLSGSETAFFSLSPARLAMLRDQNSMRAKLLITLLEKPKRLLATLLISVNFVNIGIVVLSSLMIQEVFNLAGNQYLAFLLQIIGVSLIIVLFCEVMPKIYATQNAESFALKSVYPLYLLEKLLRPASALLVLSTSVVDKRIGRKGYEVSMDELTHAIDITSDKSTPEDEKKILKGIAGLGNIDVRQIMKPRLDVIAVDIETPFPELITLIIENRYSRLPVYEETFDNIKGILFIKDLLPYVDKQENQNFQWRTMIRPAYFVPESKKINDLLQEFKETKNHLAIVVDEYGGTSGIVTLEDVLEEIVGEINDEFDDEELFYSRLDDMNFVFEGKTSLIDVCRIMNIERKHFGHETEEADSLAGLILSIRGSIPQRNEVIESNGIRFKIESADRKRIKRVKVSLPEQDLREDTGGISGTKAMLMLMVLFSFCFVSCDDEYYPKPRGYFRIALPEKEYRNFNPENCPFTFDIPVYGHVERDTSKPGETCWMNVVMDPFKATLYLSYKPVTRSVGDYIEDSRSMSMKHIPRASGMSEEIIADHEKRIFGTYYRVKGNAASPVQFYVTDSTDHFLRGALYFYAVPNPDSIAPVLAFIEKDVMKIVETFRWKKEEEKRHGQ